MEHSEVLVIKNGNNEFERYYNDGFIKDGYAVKLVSDIDYTHTTGILDRVKRIYKLACLKKKDFRSYKLIIVFEDGGLMPFLRRKVSKNTKLILWQWNVRDEMRAQKQETLKSVCEIWTFDPTDAERYGWKLNNQFYRPIDDLRLVPPESVKTAFCTCADKGRYDSLKEIRALLQHYGIECDFTLVKEGGRAYETEDLSWVKDKGITYKEFLSRTIQSDLIVDLVQKGQTGITVRVLEALFYNKKLITNNVDIKQLPFYAESNIFIYGYDDESKLKEFLEQPYTEIFNEIKEQYTVDLWVQNFIKDSDKRK